MKNRLILLSVLIACFMSMQAKKVSTKDAETVAKQLVTKEGNQTRSTSALSLVHTEFNNSGISTRTSGTTENVPTYYVFSKGDNKGFVIVSADDVATPILGYSDVGNYKTDSLPINFKSWMAGISGEIVYAIENQLEQSSETKTAWDSYLNENLRSLQTRAAVAPLVKTTWDQGTPYNKQCPGGSVTGCVATAMAQLMKYHNYPASSTAVIPGYTSEKQKYVINEIPISTYDWANMLNNYNSTTTTQQQDAVAQLMYHCGVSVQMNYTPGESGAIARYTGSALKNYFGYDQSIQYKKRAYYSNRDWENMLLAEINANRPVFYGGYGTGGHAFVCDGYDASGLFHFNWGWNGSYDGYFVTTSLNPGTGGAGSGSGTYNLEQEIIINIKPNEGGIGKPQLTLDDARNLTCDKSTLAKGESFSVTGITWNISYFDFLGKVGIAVVDENDNILGIAGQASVDIVISNGIRLEYITSSVPTNIAAGNYYLRIVVKETSDTTWSILTGAIGFADKLPVTITDNVLTHGIKIFNDTNLSSSATTVNYNEFFTVSAKFANLGSTQFDGSLGIALVNDSDEIVSFLGSYGSSFSLESGSYYTSPFSITLSIPKTVISGNYKLRAVAKPTGETNWSIVYGQTGTVIDILPLTVLASAETAWTPQSGSTDWFSGSNWSKGVPGETTKVTISQSTSYPVLSNSTKVDIIYFGTGAELKGQDLLVYNKAFVDYNFDQGDRSKHYRTRSLPLKEAYPGDFTFGSQPVVYFKVLALDPATQQAKFATVASGNVGKLAPGSGFVISTYPDAAVDKGLALSGGILRLPYFDADANVAAGVHPNQEFSASTSESTFYNPARTQSYKVTRSADAYKLADPITEVATNFVPAGKEFMALVGNPFMTSIDFSKLQNLNSNLIKDTYQIWTKEGSVEGYAGYSPEGNFGLVLTPALDNVIAPLQGFFVEQNNGATGSLTFDVTAITADSKNGILRSTPQAGNKIQIVARNTKAAVSTFVAKREYGSILLGEADSRQLINELNVAPQVYTIKACETGNALVGANITNGESAEYPIGIATTQSGQTSLTFSGMDSYDGNISFTDKVLGQTINLTGLASYEYYFDYAPKTSGNEVVPTNDRFSLRMTSATSSINDPSDFDNNQSLVVYADKGFIHATNSNGAAIKEISVYNISGVLVYQASVNASSYTTSQYFKNGVYIVKVKTDSGIDHKKVIVK